MGGIGEGEEGMEGGKGERKGGQEERKRPKGRERWSGG